MVTIKQITVARVPACLYRKNTIDTVSKEKQSDCFLKLYFKTLDKIYD